MATSPIYGDPLPNSTSTDLVPADLLTYATAAEKKFVGNFASATARDTKITSPRGGMIAWLDSPGKFTYYNAALSTWTDLFNPNTWDTWTPTLQSASGTAFTLGSGATQIGRYRQMGKTITFQATWNFGSSVIGPGGPLCFLLPPGLSGANISGLQQTGQSVLWVPSISREFLGYWKILPGDNRAFPSFQVLDTVPGWSGLQDTTDGSTAGTGVPKITGTSFDYPIQVNGYLTASGSYQIA